MFQFKKFQMLHGHGSMKIGVDAVLLASWVSCEARNILDVGTGSGIIALLLAQRNPESKILGIDIDAPSVDEARINFMNSPWKDNLSVKQLEFPKDLISKGEKYDMIISNPPYFDSGVVSPSSQRERARHQDTLSVFSLIEESPEILSIGGKLNVIFPTEFEAAVFELASIHKFTPLRVCRVKNKEQSKEKRVMMELGYMVRSDNMPEKEVLTLFEGGQPTEEYIKLCKDFYLKF